MSEEDRRRWDRRHSDMRDDDVPGLPPPFAPYEELFPTRGRALELACGRGRASVWLAMRGLTVLGIDISPVGIRSARDLAARSGVSDRCHFDVRDLDEGLPEGPPVDVVLCHLFRDARLDGAIIQRLAPGGLLAVAALSEVDHGPGPFRAKPGELLESFSDLEPLVAEERCGRAWLLSRA